MAMLHWSPAANVGHEDSRYSAAVVTAKGIDWLDLDAAIDPVRDKGVTGIAASSDHCFLAVPRANERLISLDSHLRPMDVFTCEKSRDIHSLAVHDGRLYFASTGCNQVLSVTWRFWAGDFNRRRCSNRRWSVASRSREAAGPEASCRSCAPEVNAHRASSVSSAIAPAFAGSRLSPTLNLPFGDSAERVRSHPSGSWKLVQRDVIKEPVR
jgi:hypothetical protein